MDFLEEWIAPTLVLEPSLDDDLMREEIFGPVSAHAASPS